MDEKAKKGAGWPKQTGAKKKTSKKDAAKHPAAVARATLSTEAPGDPKDYFKGASEVVKNKGLRVGYWGDAKTGKTHCALTFPKPIYVVDTEFGTYPLLDDNHGKFWQWMKNSGKVPEDQILIFEAAVLDEFSGEPDPLESLAAIERALTALNQVNFGTIILDSGADIWHFISAWLEEVAVKRTAKGDKYQFEWGKANARYRLLMMRLLTKKNVNFVITGQDRPLYVDSKATSTMLPLWQQKTKHWVDLVIRCTKASDGNFRGKVEACRLGAYKNAMINPPTYDNIIKWAKEECNKIVPKQGWTTVKEYLASLETVDEKIEVVAE